MSSRKAMLLAISLRASQRYCSSTTAPVRSSSLYSISVVNKLRNQHMGRLVIYRLGMRAGTRVLQICRAAWRILGGIEPTPVSSADISVNEALERNGVGTLERRCDARLVNDGFQECARAPLKKPGDAIGIP